MVETLVGFFFGACAGISVGLILGRNELLAKLLDPILVSIYSLPKVALAPLFIMWFGIGIEMKIILTATIVFFRCSSTPTAVFALWSASSWKFCG